LNPYHQFIKNLPLHEEMNEFSVRRLAQGLAHYVRMHSDSAMSRGVVIAYDSHPGSLNYAQQVAMVLAKSKIDTYFFSEHQPLPLLAYAIRELGAFSGIMISVEPDAERQFSVTVYDDEGDPISKPHVVRLLTFIELVKDESDVKTMPQGMAQSLGLLRYLGRDMELKYMAHALRMREYPTIPISGEEPLRIIYTPLYGSDTGLVSELLTVAGFSQVTVMTRQELLEELPPDWINSKAYQSVTQIAEEKGADIVLGTDPQAIRVVVAVRKFDGTYMVLSDDQVDTLLHHSYSNEMGRSIIPERDGVLACLLLAEMAAHSKAEGQTLIDIMLHLTKSYGSFCKEQAIIPLQCSNDPECVQKVMSYLRDNRRSLVGEWRVERILDHKQGIMYNPLHNTEEPLTLPNTDMLHFALGDGSWFAIRPSKFEPELRVDYCVAGNSEHEFKQKLDRLNQTVVELVKYVNFATRVQIRRKTKIHCD
jgi:phosphomannomutase